MAEVSNNLPSVVGRCSHGNIPGSCEQCQRGGLVVESSIKHQETRDGLPVVLSEDFYKMYNTDIRAAGAEKSATFDFRGFVRETRKDYTPGEKYNDVMATNGILKAPGHDGIHVGTDGLVDYSFYNSPMKSPDDVGEYDIYIKIPGRLQAEKGVVCYSDSCISVTEFKGDDDRDDEEVVQAQRGESYIVMRLGLDPKEDPLARKKVKVIHDAIVQFIEKGGALDEIDARTRALEAKLRDTAEEDFENHARMVEGM